MTKTTMTDSDKNRILRTISLGAYLEFVGWLCGDEVPDRMKQAVITELKSSREFPAIPVKYVGSVCEKLRLRLVAHQATTADVRLMLSAHLLNYYALGNIYPEWQCSALGVLAQACMDLGNSEVGAGCQFIEWLIATDSRPQSQVFYYFWRTVLDAHSFTKHAMRFRELAIENSPSEELQGFCLQITEPNGAQIARNAWCAVRNGSHGVSIAGASLDTALAINDAQNDKGT